MTVADQIKFNQAIIAVGSNIQPERYITRARELIRNTHQLICESRFRKTKPIGYSEQPDFTNGVFLIETAMSEKQLTAWLKETEARLDRTRTKNRNGPRTIDLDIVIWNGKVIDQHVYERDFLNQAIRELDSSLL
jgi:2-amino-4-hydroxy-6-hydroxymethyldihydropteridine diphosphokinase